MSDSFLPGPSAQNHVAELIRDFTLEWLAILFPGFGFLAAAIPSALLPAFWLSVSLDFWVTGRAFAPNFLDVANTSLIIMEKFSFLFLIVVFSMSYILGHFMFRQDPKVPDGKSFIKIHMGRIGFFKSILRWVLRSFWCDLRFPLKLADTFEHKSEIDAQHEVNSDKICSCTIIKLRSEFDGMAQPLPNAADEEDLSKIPVEFPYHYLKYYLEKRRFYDLAKLVYWDESTTFSIPGLNISLIYLRQIWNFCIQINIESCKKMKAILG